MTRILIVSPIPSHPADQGNSARIQTLAAELKHRGLTLEFFYYGMEGLTDEQRAEMESFWAKFHFMPSLPNADQTFARHWGIDDWCPPALCAAIHTLHSHHRYDAVLVNYVWMSRILENLDTYRILDTHDIFGDRHKISIAQGLEPRWFFCSPAEEERGFARAHLIIGIQEQETRTIRARTAVPAITVGHPMPPHFLTTFADRRTIATFGYIGSANPWNVRSVLALDKALGRGTAIDWMLAGSIMKRDLELCSAPYLRGMVAKLEDFYAVVDCMVNPMQGGTGLKIKTVEALAYGKAVIGTADAFAGLPARHPAHNLAGAADCARLMAAYQEDFSLRREVKLASRRLYLQYMLNTGNQLDQLQELIVNPRSRDSLRDAEFFDELF